MRFWDRIDEANQRVADAQRQTGGSSSYPYADSRTASRVILGALFAAVVLSTFFFGLLVGFVVLVISIAAGWRFQQHPFVDGLRRRQR